MATALSGSKKEGIGIAAAGPRQVGFALNSDMPHGSGVIDVKDGPMVIELPPGHTSAWSTITIREVPSDLGVLSALGTVR